MDTPPAWWTTEGVQHTVHEHWVEAITRNGLLLTTRLPAMHLFIPERTKPQSIPFTRREYQTCVDVVRSTENLASFVDGGREGSWRYAGTRIRRLPSPAVERGLLPSLRGSRRRAPPLYCPFDNCLSTS